MVVQPFPREPVVGCWFSDRPLEVVLEAPGAFADAGDEGEGCAELVWVHLQVSMGVLLACFFANVKICVANYFPGF